MNQFCIVANKTNQHLVLGHFLEHVAAAIVPIARHTAAPSQQVLRVCSSNQSVLELVGAASSTVA